jgi:hypothetical protein
MTPPVNSTQINRVNQGFTEAALAGLAAKEDFSSVKLKTCDLSTSAQVEFPPYKDLMFLQIKGNI